MTNRTESHERDWRTPVAGNTEDASTPTETPAEVKTALWSEFGFVPRQDFHQNAPLRDGAEPWRSHVQPSGGLPDLGQYREIIPTPGGSR